jgi:uncharacterized protein YecE (DUF72 family)
MYASENFFLGCAVWAYKGWVGDVYPPHSRQADFLRLYSQRLTTVEVNATFYAVPNKETVRRWAAETPSGFAFCPKLPRELTHRGLLQPSIPRALQFVELMQEFGDRLGPIFMQLPPQYGPALLDDFRAFLCAWPNKTVPLAVEVRHPDWFRESHPQALNSLLESLSIGRVLLDSRPVYSGPDDPQMSTEQRKPRLPLQPVVTAPFSLVRFVSHPHQECNLIFLNDWVQQLDQWLRQGVQTYFFVHCPVEAQSPHIARSFQHMLERNGTPVPPLPWDALAVPPTQLSLFS